jgi:hypothetical protein
MKNIIITVILCLTLLHSRACEICGCGVGNYYIGLLPQFNKTFMGFRYQFRDFHTRLYSDPTQFSHDFYQTTEIWGGWNINSKFKLLVFIPYNFSHQVSDEGTSNRNGLGDVSALLNYKLLDLNAVSKKKRLISQQVWIGAGLKVPTGRFSIDPLDPDLAAAANTQIGSGSTDVIVSAMHNIRINKIGVNTSLNYKINTSNTIQYQFGNKVTLNSIAFYTIKKKKISYSPNAGILYEQSAINKLAGKSVNQTGGWLAAAAGGLEIGFGRIAMGGNLQIPIAQNFATGQTVAGWRGMLHLSLSF